MNRKLTGLRVLTSTTLLVASLATAACGGGAGATAKDAISAEKRSGKTASSGQHVSKAAAASYDTALAEFAAHDKAFDWSEGSCKSVANAFVRASDQQKSDGGAALPESHYNAGLAYMRCGMNKDAVEQFQNSLKVNSSFHRARAQLALFDFQSNKDINGTISKLEEIIRDAKFQNAEALVGVAALQMERGSDEANSDGKNDLDRAKLNIQRALAIDDSFMPAFNQLSIYYMERAKAKSGEKKSRKRRLVVAGSGGAEVDQQQLELAALVASQAVRKNPNYAPIQNTAGLIQVGMKDFNKAVQSFGKARQLDPKFFEAHMNYAAVNLSFRGFKEAEGAYRSALQFAPNDYEAHLGLALALRGQINDSNFDQAVAESQKHLDECKRIDPSRAEAYYNEAILTQEYRAKGEQTSVIPMLDKAAEMYRQFVVKAGSDATFSEAVKRANDRTRDIQDIKKFIVEGEAAKKAEAEAAAAEAKAAAAAPPPAAAPAAAGGAAPPAGGKK